MNTKNNITNYINGWIIGNFEPSLFKTNDFEIAIKKYKAGDSENKHYHKISKEITIIISGKVSMNNILYFDGDVVFVDNFESTDFICLEDSTTCVIKIPSTKNDKFYD